MRAHEVNFSWNNKKKLAIKIRAKKSFWNQKKNWVKIKQQQKHKQALQSNRPKLTHPGQNNIKKKNIQHEKSFNTTL